MAARRKLLLLLGTGAGALGWRTWSRRRAAASEITFDWDAPPPPPPPSPPPAPPPPAAASTEGGSNVAAPEPPSGPELELPPPVPPEEATPADRERESQIEPETKFAEASEHEAEERRAAAERLATDAIVDRSEDKAD